MPLSWNDIRHRAQEFVREWSEETSEDAEAKPFWNEFFEVFGVRRRTVASFEEPVRNLAGNWSYIDLFWPSKLLVEHKSRGKSLTKANSQAMAYIRALKDAGRDNEIPRFVVVSDFATIAIYDLDEDEHQTFPLSDLPKNIRLFAFIAGYVQQRINPDDPLNIAAVELLGELHDELEAGGYTGHELERFLVRLLFCLFADKTGIFESPNAFSLYISNRTSDDGSDLGLHLDHFFRILDTEEAKRQKNLDEELATLPHVNGELFRERLGFANFNRKMRDKLLNCTRFDWSKISPAVFGSLFQSVMEPKARRQVGAHYTSESDILKVVKSLFLNDLRSEFERIKSSKAKLKEFHEKLASLKFLDPACGCGNFLVVTYRELRLLELDVLKALQRNQKVLDIHQLSRIDVDVMYGIEINEFPSRIAEVALWLVDHQMNQALSVEFGQYFVRLPLEKCPTIQHGNALRLDWKSVLAPEECTYILGNPPFVGAKYQTSDQRADMKSAVPNVTNVGLLDFVTAWYFKAADYIQGTDITVGFVSTSSITQGEQVGVLWQGLLARGIKIRFAHRTFRWRSDARGAAHVDVVIIGFGTQDAPVKHIFDYDAESQNSHVSVVKNISPYLTEGSNTVVLNRRTPICDVPKIGIGNKPIDGGNYLFTREERDAFLEKEPGCKKWFRRWLGSDEFLNGYERWCLWLGDCEPDELRSLPEAMKRVEAVRQFRINSKSAPTNKLAQTPRRFHVEKFPSKRFLVIPKVSSERRRFIPIDFMDPNTFVSDLCFILENATLFHFGVLSSTMHMAWVRLVCGRLESRYRYSGNLVYNNFPWPVTESEKLQSRVEVAAQQVLDARAMHPSSSLSDLYDPTVIPGDLVRAHAKLDKAVDACYGRRAFPTDRSRVEFLFEMYEQIVASR